MWGRKRGVDLVDTPDMDVLFAKLEGINEAQLLAMAASWKSTDRQAREDAWSVVRAVGRGQALTKEIGRVRSRAMAWATRGHNDPAAGGGLSGGSVLWQQMQWDAAEAIVDAALATALGFRLDAQTRETLLGPWLRVTEGED
jgi:hypothetical protein